MLNQHGILASAAPPSGRPSSQGLDTLALNEELHEAYCEIMTPSALAPLLALPGRSGVFLPRASLAYCGSFGRILVVGRAPKRWLNDVDLSSTTTADYVRHSTNAHGEMLKAKPGRHKFLQFLKRGNELMDGKAGTLGWCNLFATSHAKASPTIIAKRFPEAYQAIKRLSRDLLDAQLRILQPHVICFATNPSFDKQLQSYFGARMNAIAAENEGTRLRFQLDGIPAWRISHPMHLTKLDRETALKDMVAVARSAAMREKSLLAAA